MTYWLAQIIGDGLTPETGFRPATFDHTDRAGMICDGRADSTLQTGWSLCRAEADADTSGFAADSRIVAAATVADNLASWGVPFLSETTLDDRLITVIRRFRLRQWLLGRDLPALTTQLSAISQTARQQAVAIMQARGIDTSSLALSMTVAEALAIILPQISVKLHASSPSQSGTFTDNFNGAGAATNLESWTPSGGTAWTLADGVAGGAVVSSANNTLSAITTDANGSGYQCDDQGSSAQYVQGVLTAIAGSSAIGFPLCNRLSGRLNYIGVRGQSSTVLQLYKRNAGTFSQLGSNSTVAAGDTVRLESDSSDAHTVYKNGSASASIGPVTDAFNNTVTRQGLNPRSAALSNWLDDFEAGVLSAVLSATSYNLPLLGVG